MTEDDLQDVLHRCPTLYHMAEHGSWPGIRRHGLLSTAALADLFEIRGTPRHALLRTRRPACVTLDHPLAGTATVRDQKPMGDAALRRCLRDGLEPSDWYAMVNSRVYLWPDHARLLRLLGGRAYRATRHDVLELDAAALFAAYRDRIELSAINSGATFALGPAPRGLDTFQPIARFDAGRRTHTRPSGRIVEVTIPHAIPDIERFTRRVVTMAIGEIVDVTFATPDQSPVNSQSMPRTISSR